MKRFIQHILLGALFLVGTMAWAAPALSATTTLTLDPVAIDNVIDELENNDNLFLTGTTAETSLVVTLNQKAYTAVISGGTFRVTLPSADITTLPEGNNTITFTGGSGLVFTRIVQHVTSGVLLNVDPITGDNSIDAVEAASPIVVNGTATNVSDGTSVQLTLNGNSFSGTVMGGAWSITLSTSDFLSGDNLMSFSATDIPSGETGTTSATVVYDILAAISIGAISGDDTYTALEKVADNTLVLSGGVVSVEAGQTVTLTLNGTDYTTTVGAGSTWSLTLSSTIIEALGSATYTVTATTGDTRGNVGSATRSFTNEAQPDVIIDISPSSFVAGQTGVVTFTFRSDVSGFTAANVTPENASIATVNMISSTVYTTVLTPDASINQATNTLTVDSAWTFDNSATLSAATYPSSPYALSTSIPQLSVASVTADNSISSVEDDAAVSITGTSTFLEDGTALSLTLAGGTYATTINANAWSVSIPAAIIQSLNVTPTANILSVEATNNFGVSSGAITHSFGYDPNSQGEDLLITLSNTNLASSDTTTVTFSFRSPVTGFDENNVTLFGGGSLSPTVVDPSDATQYTATYTPPTNAAALDLKMHVNDAWTFVSGEDKISNFIPISSFSIVGDITATDNNLVSNVSSGWAIGAFAGDYPVFDGQAIQFTVGAILNAFAGLSATEGTAHYNSLVLSAFVWNSSGGRLRVYQGGSHRYTSGTTPGIFVGDVVTLKRNGTNVDYYINDVLYRTQGGATASTPYFFDTSFNNSGASFQNIVVVGRYESPTYAFNTVAVPTTTIATVTTDDIIDATEDDADLTITGTTSGLEDGQSVNLALAGTTYTGVVASDAYSITIPYLDIQALTAGNNTLTLDGQSAGGSLATQAMRTFEYDPNSQTEPVLITFSDTELAVGETATVSISFRSAVSAFSNANISLTNAMLDNVTSSDNIVWTATLTPMANTFEQTNAIALDATWTFDNGDTASVYTSENYRVNTKVASITIDVVATDDTIDYLEDDADVVLSGTTVGVEDGQTVFIDLAGTPYVTLSNSGAWSYTLPQAEVVALATGSLTLSVDIENLGGSTAQASRVFSYNSTEPGPDLIVTLDETEFGAGDTSLVTFSFRSNVSGFALEDITTPGGVLTNLVPTIGTQEYTATFTASPSTILSDQLITVNADWTFDNGDPLTALKEVDSFTHITTTTVTATGNTIKKISGGNNWGNAGVFAGDFPIYGGGEISMRVGPSLANNMFGLSYVEGNFSYQSIKFAAYPISAGEVHIYESGGSKGLQGTYVANDLIALKRNGTKIEYYVNNQLLYTSLTNTDPSVPMYLDASLYSNNAQYNNIIAYNPYVSPLYNINSVPVTLAINEVAGDDVIDATEHNANVIISGTTTGIEDGQSVAISLNGASYGTSVNSNAWSYTLGATTARQLPAGMHTLAVTATNSLGVSATASRVISHEIATPLRILMNDVAFAQGETTQVTFIFGNGPITGFDSNDVTVSNGTITAPTSADDGHVWTATFTPNPGIEVGNNRIIVGLDWNDADGPFSTLPAAEPIIFDTANAVSTVINGGNNLVHSGSGSWNRGAQATTYLDGDGTIEFTIGDLSTQRIRIGAANPETDFYGYSRSYDLLDFSFDLNNGNTSIYNNNSRRINNVATYQTGDTFKLQRIGSLMLYYIDGEIVYTQSNALGRIVATTLVVSTAGGDVNNFQLTRTAAGSDNYSINTTVPTLALDPILGVPEGTNTVLVSGSTTGVPNGTNVSLAFSGQTHTAAVTDNAFSLALPLVDVAAAALVAGTYPLTADVSNNVGTAATQATTNVIIEAAVPTEPLATISLDETILGVGDTANLQIVFNSAVANFDGTDINLTNASLTTGPSSVDNITWTAVLTPMAGTLVSENNIVIGNAWNFVDSSTTTQTSLGFVNAVNLDDADNGLRASTAGAWGTAGGFAQQTLTADGALSLGFVAGTAADAAAIGFSQADASNNLHYNTIDGGLRFDNTGVSVVENGSVAHNIPLANVDAANDTFVIQRLGTSLVYKQNGTTFYSGTTAAGELQVHAAFLNSSAQIRDLQLSGSLGTRFDNYAVNTLVPSITLNAISQDNNITSDEDDSGIVLAGTTAMAEEGAAITATWNGVDYTTTQSNDAWWIQIPPADVAALPTGSSTVSVSVTTGGGASANAAQVVSHDLTERVVMTISDDFLEFGETAQIGITFATAVENFAAADLTADDAMLSAFSGSGTAWSATLTPEGATFSANNKVRLGTEWNNTGDAATEQGRLLGSTNAVGVLVDGATLTKYSTSTDWNAGNFSVRSLVADGSISFGSSDPGNTTAYIGFTDDSYDAFYQVQSAIDYAFYLNNGSVSVVENNTTKAADVATLTTGDRLRIERIGAGVRYYKNSTLLYTSLTASSGTLYVDTSFNAPGSVLTDIYLHEFGFATTPAYAVNTAGTIPALGMNVVAGDDVIDNTEDELSLFVSGTATNVIDGTALNLTVNGVSYATTISANAWSVTIPNAAVAVLPTSNVFNAAVVVNGTTYMADRTVTRDINLPALNFIGGATNFTDPSVSTQIAILFREAVTDFEIEDFFVEGATLSNLASTDGGTSWTADFTPNQLTVNPNGVIVLGVDYTYVSSGLAPVINEIPVVWSDRDPEILVTNTNDLSFGAGLLPNRSATTGLNFPVESGSSITYDTDNGSYFHIGINYLERIPGAQVAPDYGLVRQNSRYRVYEGLSNYGTLGVTTSQSVRLSRRGERVLLFIDDQLHFTFNSFLVGPLYPQVRFNSATPIRNTRISQDITLSSSSYSVQTRLNITNTSVSGNVITVDFDQPLNAASLATVETDLRIAGASIFISDTTVSGNQLILTYSGPTLADGTLATVAFTTVGGKGLAATNGALAGSTSIQFSNGNQPIVFSSAAGYDFGTPLADTFTVNAGNIFAGGGDDTIYWGAARGAGGNTYTGGTGRDTYIKVEPSGNINFTARGEYNITDFETGAAGDIIDVSQAIAYDSAAGHDLINFIYVINNGTDTILRFANPLRPIDQGPAFTSSLRLKGIITTVAQLIADGNLIVE
ncbi:Ig-like domain-containing protein [Flavobacteriaceae bacterium]|nr:Ig-like domain-containing protein [Flavobacteriaceae bacterium]